MAHCNLLEGTAGFPGHGMFVSPGSGFARCRRRLYSGDGPFCVPWFGVSVDEVGVYLPGMVCLGRLGFLTIGRRFPPGLVRLCPPYGFFGSSVRSCFSSGERAFVSPGLAFPLFRHSLLFRGWPVCVAWLGVSVTSVGVSPPGVIRWCALVLGFGSFSGRLTSMVGPYVSLFGGFP